VDLYAVMDEITTQVHTITGLRAATWSANTVTAPALIVGWPDRVDYAQTYQRYQSRCTDLPLLVVCGKASERVSAKRLGEYVAETGARSVPAKLLARAGAWVACDLVNPSWVGFPAVTIAGVDYLAAEFHLDVVGKGAQ
jgi:hypothetical protein